MAESNSPGNFLRKAILIANQTDQFARVCGESNCPPVVPVALAQALSAISPDDFRSLPASHERIVEPLKVIGKIVQSVASGQSCGSASGLLAAARTIREGAREIEDTARIANLIGMSWTGDNNQAAAARFESAQKVKSLAESPEAVANNLDRIACDLDALRAEKSKPQYLEVAANRLAAQAARLFIRALRQFDPPLIHPHALPGGVFEVDEADDRQVLWYWGVFLTAVLRAFGPEHMPGGAGKYDVIPTKPGPLPEAVKRKLDALQEACKQHNWIAAVKRVEAEHPVVIEVPPVPVAAPPEFPKPASEFNETDWLHVWQERSRDWAAYCRAAAAIVRLHIDPVDAVTSVFRPFDSQGADADQAASEANTRKGTEFASVYTSRSFILPADLESAYWSAVFLLCKTRSIVDLLTHAECTFETIIRAIEQALELRDKTKACASAILAVTLELTAVNDKPVKIACRNKAFANAHDAALDIGLLACELVWDGTYRTRGFDSPQELFSLPLTAEIVEKHVPAIADSLSHSFGSQNWLDLENDLWGEVTKATQARAKSGGAPDSKAMPPLMTAGPSFAQQQLQMQIASALTMPVGLDQLFSKIAGVPPGKDHWDEYEKTIEPLLTAIFSQVLFHPECQCRIHEGRKRIDITYKNGAIAGFFHWLAVHYRAAHIFVEAKNYDKDAANPELDQLAGRFSEQRGKIGLLVCRGFEDKRLFLKRCRDTASDERGFIIPVDDKDLEVLVLDRMDPDKALDFPLLRNRFTDLVMNRDSQA